VFFTRTTLGSRARLMCGMSAACGVSVLDVLDALRLVRVGEPVLAHVQVVAETAGGASHEYLGDGEGRHCLRWCRVCVWWWWCVWNAQTAVFKN
jgi:hypothetical protein